MSPRSRRGSLLVAALIASALTISLGPFSAFDTPAVHAADLGAGGEFHPLTPTRIFDSRPGSNLPGSGAPATLSVNGGAVDIQVLGQGPIPSGSSDVLAVVLNFTVVNPQSQGFLKVYPSGAAAGDSSVLNFVAGQTVPNLSVLTVGANGKVTAQIGGGVNRADVLVDVFGWFSTSTYANRGARLIATSPGRIFDSREPGFQTQGKPLGQNGVVTLPIRGATTTNPETSIPNSPDVKGVVINVTGINDGPGAVPTFVSVLPEAPVLPVTTSNLNLVPGQIKANLAIVPVGADGNVRLYNLAGSTNIAVDVVGYMLDNQSSATRLGRVIPLTAPFRAFDTRLASFGNVPLGPAQSETWSFTQFVNSVMLGGQPVGKEGALIGNLTGTELSRTSPTVPASTFFTVYPSGPNRPFSSNINVTEGANIPNLAVVKLSADNSIDAYNNQGNIHYLFDVAAVVLAD